MEHHRTALNAYYILSGTFLVILLPAVYAFLWQPRFVGGGVSSFIALECVIIVLFVMLKRGYTWLVCQAIVIIALLCFLVALLVNGGIRTIALLATPLVLLCANLLLERRTTTYLYSISVVLVIIGVYWAERLQFLTPVQSGPVTLHPFALVLLMVGLTIFYLSLAFVQVTYSTAQVQEQSASLLRTVEKLQKIRHSLEQRTEELSTTNAHLVATQRQLAEAEKLAALGNLVAGIAHEINTPLGVGITAATTLQAITDELQEHYGSRAIRRTYFEAFLADAVAANHLLVNNLLRVDQLVQSFKQLSVDHFTLERRRFQLKAYLEEIVRGLEPRLRSGAHSVEILVDESIYLDSYPGALAQIATNFILNSILHGYPSGKPGRLRFIAGLYEEYVRLIYADDGIGICKEHLDKIYEPFFTTARDRGGTGLGLHIVYNLVTQKLGGTIRHDSDINAGVIFSLELPLYLEEREESA
ncbi:MAG: HAMP domain-containing histidine kinase [Caldilineaceae bacterium]|nr:HAMP domain-containing histidine kinase [Caldilineaceae bacterium]